MTGLTDQWLRTEFQDHARTIDPPADLHQQSMWRARATRKRRKGLQAAFTVGLAAAVTGVIVIVTGALPSASAFFDIRFRSDSTAVMSARSC